MENINEENLDASVQDGSSNEADKFVPLTEEALDEMEVVEKDDYMKSKSYADNQRKRAEKAEALIKEMKAGKPEVKPVVETPKEDSDEFSKFAKYSSMVKDLDTDEIEHLTLQAQDLGVSPEKFVSSTSGKASLDSFRNTRKEENKTPSPSSRVAVYKGKSFDEVAKDEKSSKEDKQKAFEAVMAKGRS